MIGSKSIQFERTGAKSPDRLIDHNCVGRRHLEKSPPQRKQGLTSAEGPEILSGTRAPGCAGHG